MTTPTRSGQTISLVLVDDQALVRRAVGDRLAAEPDIEVLGSAANADDGIAAISRMLPDVGVLDIDMPGRSIFDAAKAMRAAAPKTNLLFLSAYTRDSYIEQALRVGGAGYLTKDQSPDEVANAVRLVAAGRTAFAPSIVARLVFDGSGVSLRASDGPLSLLSDRETEVMGYLARGLSKKEIASTMHLSVKTIENHAGSLMGKLDIHDRVELTLFAIREGLTSA